MRRLSIVSMCLLLMCACAGPHSTGAMWALQSVRQETAFFALTEAERASRVQAYELTLVDTALQSERQRLDLSLQVCPGVQQPLMFSTGDAVRDTVRLRAGGDAQRMTQVAQLALADWYVRRAAATNDPRFCQTAQASLANPPGTASSELLAGLPMATVTRDSHTPSPPPTSDPTDVVLSNYVLGVTDGVTAQAPLPQYLAVIYGGSLQTPSSARMDDETAAANVDRAAPAYPQWEPDALYAALRG